MGKLSDQELLDYLQGGDRTSVNEAITFLYRQLYGKVTKFIKNYKGTDLDVEDIFQDGLLALHRLVQRGDLKPDVNLQAYFFTICKNLWLLKLRKKPAMVDIEANSLLFKMPEMTLPRLMKQEEQEEIQRLMELIGENCRRILTSYYHQRMRMREIAHMMGYASDQVAKNKKSECMKKLKTLATQSPVFKDQIS